ncbi:H(+)/Cl(-) exchange transporter ClcA [Synechococcus elongatus]|uniref:H(+)/Cl(-) exchange transporter ClcA n=1 Tax=Synechococcus elongatus PCC 11801 TaxID=2219813 RepID=A0AAQ3R8D2_SYNEL
MTPDSHSFVSSLLASRMRFRRFLEASEGLNLVLLWAAIAGLMVGLVGGAFRWLTSATLNGRVQWLASLSLGPELVASVLLSGGMVALGFYLMRRYAPDTSGSGIPQIEGWLAGFFPMLWRRVLTVKFLAGILTLGSGMVMGREGPTIQMGGAIGQMVSSWCRASTEQARVLVAACAGAGLATAFNAPLAGIVFVFEEMRPTFQNRLGAYQAVTIACITATISTQLLLGKGPTIELTQFGAPPLSSLWVFVLLGLACGAVGYSFNRLLVWSLDRFATLQGLPLRLTGLGVGGFIGLVSWLYPPATNSGENLVLWAFDTVEPVRTLLLLCSVRFALTLLCYGSGAPGGIFAPLLSIATLFSLGLGQLTVNWLPELLPQPEVLAIAGMGALVAATVQAPLTAILLTTEITSNYWLILPIMVSCLAATLVAHGLGNRPIYTVLLERRLTDAGISLPKMNPRNEALDL